MFIFYEKTKTFKVNYRIVVTIFRKCTDLRRYNYSLVSGTLCLQNVPADYLQEQFYSYFIHSFIIISFISNLQHKNSSNKWNFTDQGTRGEKKYLHIFQPIKSSLFCERIQSFKLLCGKLIKSNLIRSCSDPVLEVLLLPV